MTPNRAYLLGLIAGMAFGCTTAFGQTYQTLTNSLGKVTVNTAYGSQNQPGLLVLPTYGMELTDSLSAGFPASPDVNVATAVSDGKSLTITTASLTDGSAGLQASRALVPVRSFMVETHTRAYLDLPLLIQMTDPASTAFSVTLAGKLLTPSTDLQPYTLTLDAFNAQGQKMGIALARQSSALDGSFSFKGTVDASFGLSSLSYSLDVPSGTLASVQVTSLTLTPFQVVVPEPGAGLLMGLGLLGLGLVRRRAA